MKLFKFMVHSNKQFSNNEKLPILLCKDAVAIANLFPARKLLAVLKRNGWYNGWKNGIYEYHHYHSITHEVLIAYAGSAVVQLGGDEGLIITFTKGDALIIPAGVAHKNLGGRDGFACVGAYPDGMQYDMYLGTKAERKIAEENILAVPIPVNDPVFGTDAYMLKHWHEIKKDS